MSIIRQILKAKEILAVVLEVAKGAGREDLLR